jgi:curved DNA-binding protein CbpA
MNKTGNPSFPEHGAEPAELKRRYRELTLRYHPDLNPDNPGWSTRIMQEINAAYDILRENLTKSGHAPEKAPRRDIRQIISDGDSALSEAVMKQWLTRLPRDRTSTALRQRIIQAAVELKPESPAAPPALRREYFHTLFTLFIRTTDPDIFLPFAGALNSTSFFRRLARANRRLAGGMHLYYSSRERSSFPRLSRVASGYLENARWLYRTLLLESRDRSFRLESRLESRLELAELFLLRLEDPRINL